MTTRTLAIVLLAVTLGGCSSWIRDLSDLIHSTPQVVDSVGFHAGSGLIRGIRDTLTNEESKRKLGSLIDALTMAVDSSVTATRDTLLGETTKQWLVGLKDELLGAKTKEQIAAVRDELLGPKTRALLARIIHDEVLGPQTRGEVSRLLIEGVLDPLNHTIDEIMTNLRTRDVPALRDSLLGQTTQGYVDSLVSRTFARLDTSVARTFQGLRDEGKFLSFSAKELFWMAAAAIGALVAFISWVLVRAYRERKIIDVLTYQIHDYTQRTGDTTLTDSIKDSSKRAGTEGYLRPMLVKKGLVKPQAA